MKWWFSGLIFLLAVFGRHGHVYSQDIAIDQIKGLRIEKVEGKELILAFTVSVRNPASRTFGVKIKKGKVYRNGDYMGKVGLVKKIRVRGGMNENLEVKLKVALEKELNLLEEGMRALSGGSLELRATGAFKATWFIFGKKFPFDYKERVL